MHARVSTIEGLPERMDDATRHLQEQALPQLRQMDGFKGFVALGDRQSGKVLGVAFWESEEALRATEVEVSGVRSGAAEAAGGTVASVENYEVVVFEAPSAGPISGVTDTVGDTVSGVTGTVGGATDSVRGATDNLLGGGEKGGEEKQR
jgi:heme-degrading monooxygenase HmoA